MKRSDGHADLRVRRTHKLLWDAFMAELSVRAFEEITVTDICTRAMVHRTTFYTHYADKYALLEQGMHQMYDALLADLQRHPNALSGDDPSPALIQLFVHVADHQHFYKLMLCGAGIGRFQQLVKAYMVEQMATKQRAGGDGPPALAVPPALHAHVFAGGFISMLAWWLAQDMPLSPQQMAHYFVSLHGQVHPPCG